MVQTALFQLFFPMILLAYNFIKNLFEVVAMGRLELPTSAL